MRFLLLILALLLAIAPALHAEEENPFNKRFNGPYAKGIRPEFRKATLNVGEVLRASLRNADNSKIKTTADLKNFYSSVLDPELAKLSPTTEEETKMKEGAVYLKTLLHHMADPNALPLPEQKAADEFLAACLPTGYENNLPNMFAGLFTRYAGFAAGGLAEEARKGIEKAYRPEAAEGVAKVDPFVKKFGGPYRAADGISPAFRESVSEYCANLRNHLATRRKEGLGDRESFKKYCVEVVNPALAKLVPANDAEKKMKEAAVLLRDLYGFTIDPTAFKEEATRLEHQAFLDAAALYPASRDNVAKLADGLERYSAFAQGLSLPAAGWVPADEPPPGMKRTLLDRLLDLTR